MIPPPPISTLFPYTTLFRSNDSLVDVGRIDLRVRLGGKLCAVTAAEIGKLDDENARRRVSEVVTDPGQRDASTRSEEHTSELQSLAYLVCRLLLEKKKTKNT